MDGVLTSPRDVSLVLVVVEDWLRRNRVVVAAALVVP
jgi:hypothetical protein